MAFILSTATTVSAPFNNALSVNTSVNSNQQLLFQLSNTEPVYDFLINFQTTVSITVYAPGPEYSVIQSTDCQAANTIDLRIDPGFCGTPINNLIVDEPFFVNSYSYQKSRNTYGQETWSLASLPKVLDEDGDIIYESIMFRGVATGTFTNAAQTGVESVGNTVKSFNMAVAGGFPGVGTANELFFGRVVEVGGGVGPGDSDGNASVSIPYTQIPNVSETFARRVRTIR